ncbi:MAG: type IV pilus assembly protein PilM [bacterium]|nr:type IV pilus assembly protein PilM [bacterium]
MSSLPQIGLDIGSASIKIAELVPTGKDKWRLLTAASSPTAAASSLDKINPAVMSQTIAKIVKEAGIHGKRVVASLPEDKVSTHLLDMPILADAEVAQALQWQVEQYIPIPLDQAVWSHQVVKKDDVSGQMEVLIVAAPKTLVTQYQQIIESAGLEAVAFETELTATARATVAANSPLTALVDIGATSTDIGVVRGGQLLLSRSVPTAGEAFTRSIETTLGLEKGQAESYKNTYGFSSAQLAGKLLEAMKPVLAIITAEIKKTVDFYASKHAGEAVKSVVLVGGVAALPDIVTVLSANLGLEVAVGNPLARVELDSAQAQALKGHEPFYAVALGLAQRND